MVAGDANEIPGDRCIQFILEADQGTIISNGIPARFEGAREIDSTFLLPAKELDVGMWFLVIIRWFSLSYNGVPP